MRIFVAKDDFMSRRGQVVCGTVFALTDNYYLPRPSNDYHYDHTYDWDRYFTELDMVMRAPEPQGHSIEELTLTPPKPIKKKAKKKK